jgi:cell division protein ZapA
MIEKSPKSEIDQRQASESRGGESRSTTFDVVIAGVPMRLKSSNDVETVNELVALVDRKVREALPLTKTGSIQNASILAALNLAEEYLLLKRKAKIELERLETRAMKVISELENSRVTGLNGTGSAEKLDQ